MNKRVFDEYARAQALGDEVRTFTATLNNKAACTQLQRAVEIIDGVATRLGAEVIRTIREREKSRKAAVVDDRSTTDSDDGESTSDDDEYEYYSSSASSEHSANERKNSSVPIAKKQKKPPGGYVCSACQQRGHKNRSYLCPKNKLTPKQQALCKEWTLIVCGNRHKSLLWDNQVVKARTQKCRANGCPNLRTYTFKTRQEGINKAKEFK